MTKDEILGLRLHELEIAVRKASGRPLFMPARDVNSAWSLMENLREAGINASARTVQEDSPEVMHDLANAGEWRVRVIDETPERRNIYEAYAISMPEAVCRAFLRYHYSV